MTDEIEEMIRLWVVVGFDFGIILRGDLNSSESMFFEKELKLVPIVIFSVLVGWVLEGVHGDFTWLISWDDLAD